MLNVAPIFVTGTGPRRAASFTDGGACSASDASVYPAFHIIGVPKCGTSYLYSLLTSHADVIEAVPGKEHCPDTTSPPFTRKAFSAAPRVRPQVHYGRAQPGRVAVGKVQLLDK